MINRTKRFQIPHFGAESIAEALGGRKSGSGWSARCPAHDDRSPSLSLRDTPDGRVLVYCHAGCKQDEVISKLKAFSMWTQSGQRLSRCVTPSRVTMPTKQDRDDVNRTEAALAIWHTSKPADGSLIETYLGTRGLMLPATLALRLHPCLKHPSGGIWPAMIALVRRGTDGPPLGIHRTFLERNGTSKAPVSPQKMMLGPCRGGAVRLAEPGDVLMIGEGIETCLAAMQETGHPAWAALSTSGLRALDLPKAVRDVIVLADGDDPGEAAARDCALRWKRDGRRVRIARPPKGMDFNDMLVGRVSSILEGAQ
jgi:putative DNA primase/helicase